jgi:hypothetical protein
MKANASVSVKTFVITPVDPATKSLLYVQLEIDCAVCGGTEGLIFGHHLRTLHKAIGMVLEANPDLCGDIGEITQTTEFSGMVDPQKVQLN